MNWHPSKDQKVTGLLPAQEVHCSVKMATNGSTDSFLKEMLVLLELAGRVNYCILHIAVRIAMTGSGASIAMRVRYAFPRNKIK